MNTKITNMSKKAGEILKLQHLQHQVAEIAEENKKKVEALQAKFEKVEREAYDECPVCYDSISVKNTCCMPNCDHKMCKNCYYKWMDEQEKNTCPMCRAEVFKNNNDIKTKREALQHSVNSLLDQMGDLIDDRREIRKDILRSNKEYEEMREDINNLYTKYEQLDNEVFDKQQIVDEIREYERHHDIWKKKRKHRLARLIRIGREKWRTKIINVHKELFKKNFSWFEDELAVREEYKPCSDDEVDISESNMFDETYCDEVDLSELNMFDEPEDLLDNIDDCCLENRIGERDLRSEHKFWLEDCLGRIQNGEIRYSSAYNYAGYGVEDGDSDSDTVETSSMPELIDATDQELEDIVLNETEIEEGEIIEHSLSTRSYQPMRFDVIAINEDRSTGEVTSRNISIRI
jgi:hypothetical protein